MLVNLGIDIPRGSKLRSGRYHGVFQSKRSDWDGPVRRAGAPTLTDAGGPAAALPGALHLSAVSFALIRGGHVDMAVLGAQIDAQPSRGLDDSRQDGAGMGARWIWSPVRARGGRYAFTINRRSSTSARCH
jgi:hypothetical protein